MAKKKKYNRLKIIIISLVFLSVGAWLLLSALKDSIIYYYTPQELVEAKIKPNSTIRVGGFVKENTLKPNENGGANFTITYKENDTKIIFNGVLPSLIREGQGVVVIATFLGDKTQLVAKEVLAKHDENYLPPDVYKDMKKQGKIDAYFGKN